ncbi:Lipoate--protein ligase family protein OS=Streptomyces alboniger OX=132473 GN=CP975_29830 PE=4 SV=1 [Streptomyces alboniger]
MFVEPGNAVTYSSPCRTPSSRACPSQDSYAYLDDWVLGALADMGVESHWCRPLLDDIATDASAGRRREPGS